MLALVTGASSGMGLEYATQLARKGHDVLLVSNQEEALQEVARDLREQYGVQAIPLMRDLARQDAADELYAWCGQQGLEVDILVNNAGMFFFKELQREDEARLQAMLNLHVVTPTKLSLLFGSRMKERGRGYILNMSSLAASLTAPGITVYGSTKAYLKSFSRAFYYEMKPYGVHVTTVCPGAIATPLYGLRPDLMRFGVKIGVIKTPSWLVRRALRGLRCGRRLVQPGLMNLYLPAMVHALPRFAVSGLWKKFK